MECIELKEIGKQYLEEIINKYVNSQIEFYVNSMNNTKEKITEEGFVSYLEVITNTILENIDDFCKHFEYKNKLYVVFLDTLQDCKLEKDEYGDCSLSYNIDFSYEEMGEIVVKF